MRSHVSRLKRRQNQYVYGLFVEALLFSFLSLSLSLSFLTPSSPVATAGEFRWVAVICFIRISIFIPLCCTFPQRYCPSAEHCLHAFHRQPFATPKFWQKLIFPFRKTIVMLIEIKLFLLGHVSAVSIFCHFAPAFVH